MTMDWIDELAKKIVVDLDRHYHPDGVWAPNAEEIITAHIRTALDAQKPRYRVALPRDVGGVLFFLLGVTFMVMQLCRAGCA
jgi:hypothetical protein